MILAVEADGASYRDSGSVRDRDRLRQEHLERLGWRFHRLWSTNWFHDADNEVAKLREAYDQAVASSPPVETLPQSQPNPDSHSDSHSDSHPGPEPDPHPEPDPDSHPGPEPDPHPEPQIIYRSPDSPPPPGVIATRPAGTTTRRGANPRS